MHQSKLIQHLNLQPVFFQFTTPSVENVRFNLFLSTFPTLWVSQCEDIEADNSNNKQDDSKETESEDEEAELGKSSYIICSVNITIHSMKHWHTPVYAFFRLTPAIVYVDGCKVHIFECAASHCKCKTRFIHHYSDTGDISSTSNLH